ncbi:MAG: CHAD domain-containing protein [Planctomycetes bacterium]|nr:CHAD domain-containing protein [Planctomycetota bacterium]
MTDLTETEFKLRAHGPIESALLDAVVRESAFTCRAIDTRRHEDVYFDDDTGSLFAMGIGLRVRQDARTRRATCKRRGSVENGLAIRLETDALWPGDAPPSTAADLPAEVRDAIEPFVADRPLVETLRIRTDRETRFLQIDRHDVCEVMLDRCETRAKERAASFAEVEIEVIDDVAACERLALALAERLPIRAVDDDKPSHASRLLGIGPHAPETAAPDDGGTAAVVRPIAADLLREVRRAEVAVRTHDGPEHVHTMRTALRRLRGLVRSFRGVWGNERARAILERLANESRRLGVVRDLDAMLGVNEGELTRLPRGLQTAGANVLAWIRERRAAALSDLRAWLRSSARLADARTIVDELAFPGSTDVDGPPFRDHLAARIAELAATARRRTSRLPGDLPLGPTHAARIAVKRVRYLVETFAKTLPLPEKVTRRLGRLQADLGDLCDHETACARWVAWIDACARSDHGPAFAAALGAFAAIEERRLRRARKRAARTLAGIPKKFWLRLTRGAD